MRNDETLSQDHLLVEHSPERVDLNSFKFEASSPGCSDYPIWYYYIFSCFENRKLLASNIHEKVQDYESLMEPLSQSGFCKGVHCMNTGCCSIDLPLSDLFKTIGEIWWNKPQCSSALLKSFWTAHTKAINFYQCWPKFLSLRQCSVYLNSVKIIWSKCIFKVCMHNLCSQTALKLWDNS